MGDGFGVAPEPALEPAARRFRAVADDLARAAADLQGALGALGDVCGGDEQGRRFAAAYQPRADEGLRALDQLARAVGSLPGALDGAAAAYRDEDGAGARGLGAGP